MQSVADVMLSACYQEEMGGAILPAVVPLSSENLDQDGIFLLETGEDAYLYVGKQASVELVHQLFGVNSVDEVVTGQVFPDRHSSIHHFIIYLSIIK